MKRFMSKFSTSKDTFNVLFWLIKVYRHEAKINWYKTFIFCQHQFLYTLFDMLELNIPHSSLNPNNTRFVAKISIEYVG